MGNWKVFLDLYRDGQLWHIANVEHTGSICSAESEIQGLPIGYDSVATKPMCSECLKIAAQPPAAETGARGDDSGYTELLDELSGKIKGLERELATAQREALEENRQKRNMYLAFMLVTEQIAEALGYKSIEGYSTQDFIEHVKAQHKALELIEQVNHDYRAGEGTIGVNYALSTVFKAAHDVLSPRQPDPLYGQPATEA